MYGFGGSWTLFAAFPGIWVVVVVVGPFVVVVDGMSACVGGRRKGLDGTCVRRGGGNGLTLAPIAE